VSPARGVAEGGVPDRATLKTTSGAMVASPPLFSRALHVVPLAYPAAPSRLELFKPLDATVERSYHPSTLTLDELHELR
jgi:hypothetical protein